MYFFILLTSLPFFVEIVRFLFLIQTRFLLIITFIIILCACGLFVICTNLYDSLDKAMLMIIHHSYHQLYNYGHVSRQLYCAI